MRNHATTAAALLAAGLFAISGCADEPSALLADSGTDGGDDADHIIEGGGTTGGPIDGSLVIWFLDDPSGAPIGGVRVMVGGDAAGAIFATTDAEGRAAFEDPSLQGPVDVHYLGAGYPAGSLFGIDAAYVTVAPRQIGYDPDTPTAVITGTVTGLEAVPAPEDPTTQRRIAVVSFGLPIADLVTDDYDEIEQATDPEFGVPANVVAPDLPDGGKDEFSLEAYARPGTLYAVAGIFDAAAGALTAYAVAVEPGFDPSQGGTDGIELVLEFETPETNAVEVTIDPLPSEYEVVGAHALFDLGADGTFAVGVPPVGSGGPFALRLPDVGAAPFDEAAIYFGARAGQDVEGAADDYPNGQRIRRDVTVEAAIGSGIEVCDMPAAPAALSWDGAVLSMDAPAPTSFAGARAENEDEDVLWSATIFDPPMGAVPLPPFPDDWGWEGLPSAGLRFYASAAVVDGDVNEMVIDDLWYSLLAASEDAIDVE